METVLFALPGNETLTQLLANQLKATIGEFIIRHFPDGESYLRILTDVKDKKVGFICSFHQPDEKLLPVYFLSRIAKDLGASCTCLIAPYLAYMRQDKIFQPGEGITSKYFAQLISSFADSIITVDPHLHRIDELEEIYSIPSKVVHATTHISNWIKKNIKKPLLIGPDSESEQWVSEIARKANAPFIILKKTRIGDREVKVSIPQVELYQDHTPVLVDDIISTGKTMMTTSKQLKKAGMKPPICIGIHAVFSDSAYKELIKSGVSVLITCNTIPHETNRIDLSDLFLDFIRNFEKN